MPLCARRTATCGAHDRRSVRLMTHSLPYCYYLLAACARFLLWFLHLFCGFGRAFLWFFVRVTASTPAHAGVGWRCISFLLIISTRIVRPTIPSTFLRGRVRLLLLLYLTLFMRAAGVGVCLLFCCHAEARVCAGPQCCCCWFWLGFTCLHMFVFIIWVVGV